MTKCWLWAVIMHCHVGVQIYTSGKNSLENWDDIKKEMLKWYYISIWHI